MTDLPLPLSPATQALIDFARSDTDHESYQDGMLAARAALSAVLRELGDGSWVKLAPETVRAIAEANAAAQFSQQGITGAAWQRAHENWNARAVAADDLLRRDAGLT